MECPWAARILSPWVSNRLIHSSAGSSSTAQRIPAVAPRSSKATRRPCSPPLKWTAQRQPSPVRTAIPGFGIHACTRLGRTGNPHQGLPHLRHSPIRTRWTMTRRTTASARNAHSACRCECDCAENRSERTLSATAMIARQRTEAPQRQPAADCPRFALGTWTAES
jgi:hypothetical protein